MYRLTLPSRPSQPSQQAIAILLVMLAYCPLLQANDPWVLATEDERIKVYTRSVEGSSFKAVKATMVANTNTDKIANAFGDGDGCAGWREMCKSSRVLEVASETERFVYMVLDLPWPISDRDVVMHSVTEIDADSDTATVHLRSASQKYPEQKHVRAQCNGKYVLKALNEEQVEVSYIMHADLGGNLSPGIISSRQVESTLKEMNKLLALTEQ